MMYARSGATPAVRSSAAAEVSNQGAMPPMAVMVVTKPPVLLVHGALDDTVAVTDAERLQARVPGRSTLLVLPDADHADIGSIHDGKPSLVRFLHDAGVLPGSTTVPSPTVGRTGRPEARTLRRHRPLREPDA